MNKILVAVDSAHPSGSAAVYALHLAQRIQAQIFFLLIDHPGDGVKAKQGKVSKKRAAQKELQALINGSRRRDGVMVSFYVANGSYETELVNFVEQNRISLLVVGFPPSGQQEEAGRFLERLMSIKQQISCRIMIVSEKLSSTGLTVSQKAVRQPHSAR